MIKNYIKNYEKYSIVISSLLIILSVILICKPLMSLEVFITTFSVIMLINGISRLISYFRSNGQEKLFSLDLVYGIITILAGIMTYIYRLNLISLFPIILGIWIIVSNLIRLQLSINLSSIKNSGWIWLVLISVLMIILGIVLIANPFKSVITITTISGILLLISELTNLMECIYILLKIRKI